MNRVLYKRSWRELKGQRGRLSACLSLVFVGVMVFVLFSMMIPTTYKSFEVSFEEQGYPDLVVMTYAPRADVLSRVSAVDGVEVVEARYHLFGSANTTASGDIPADIYGMDTTSPQSLFRTILRQGVGLAPHDNDSALVAWTFAGAAGIVPGDSVTVRTLGRSVTLRVAGIVSSIEHIMPGSGNPRQLIPQTASLAPIWVDISVLQSLAYSGSGERDVVNELLIRLDDAYDSGQVTTDILDAISMHPVIASYTRAEMGIDYYIDGSGYAVASLFMNTFGGVVLILASFVVYSTVRRLIESQARHIGVTRALGYRVSEIQRSYLYPLCVMGCVLTVIGTLAGIALGPPVSQLVLDSYGLSSVPTEVSVPTIVLALIVGPMSVFIAAYAPIRRISGYEPVRAIRGLAMQPVVLRPTLIERGLRLVHVRGYIVKYVARGLSLNRTRTALMVLGIALGAGLAGAMDLTASNIGSSIDWYMDANEHWDLLVDFERPLSVTEAQSLLSVVQDIEDYEPFLKTGARMETPSGPRLTSLVCIDMEGVLHTFDVVDGSLPDNETEIAVGSQTSRYLGIGLHDAVNLTLGNTTERLVVSGVLQSPISAVYVPLQTAHAMLNSSTMTGIFVKTASQSSIPSVKNALTMSSGVESVQTREDVKRGVTAAFEMWGIVISFMALIGVALLLLVVSNVVATSTGERLHEMAMLEATGWPLTRLLGILLLEVLIAASLGILLAPIVSLVMVYEFTGAATELVPYFRLSLDLYVFVRTAAITLVAAVVATLPSALKLRRMDPVAVIKEQFVG